MAGVRPAAFAAAGVAAAVAGARWALAGQVPAPVTLAAEIAAGALGWPCASGSARCRPSAGSWGCGWRGGVSAGPAVAAGGWPGWCGSAADRSGREPRRDRAAVLGLALAAVAVIGVALVEALARGPSWAPGCCWP